MFITTRRLVKRADAEAQIRHFDTLGKYGTNNWSRYEAFLKKHYVRERYSGKYPRLTYYWDSGQLTAYVGGLSGYSISFGLWVGY